MTNQEAIDFGEMWLELQEDSKDSNTYEFFKIAIQALKQEPLTEEDYIELHDRFGDYVVFVVRDMVSGKGERWTKNNPQEPKTDGDCISRKDAEALFRNARQNLFEHREQYSATEFHIRDLMLLNAEQMIHLLPSVQTIVNNGTMNITL